MKVIGIAGSLRPDSNTLKFVQHCLTALDEQGLETELISLRDKTIKPCQGCYKCVKLGHCVQEDDDFAPILEKMKAAQGLVIGSPVYVSSVVPQVMSLLDRATFVALWNDRFFSGKVGGPITVARRAGHNMAFSQLLLWYFINGLVIPGSTYWNVGVAGARGARDAEKDEEGLATVRNFALHMAAVMKKLLA
ncbi:MAG: flavodoxin family protein [Thermodesulfobacteriota bacterium]